MLRRRSSTFPISLFLVLWLGTIVLGQDSKVIDELNVVHRELSEALESRDVKRIRSFYSPSFYIRLRNNKTLNLDDILTLLSLAETPTITDSKHSSVIQKLKVSGADAVITVENSRDATYKLDDGSEQRVIEVVRQQERWTKQPDGWKLSVIEDIEQKRRDVTANGRKTDEVMPKHVVPLTPNVDDQTVLNEGNGIVFIYRMGDGAIIKPPIYCNDQKLAQMTGGSFLKLKLQPGKYTLKSEKGDPIDLQVEAGKISLLVLKMEAGFPKGRGNLRVDRSIMAAQAYKLPRLLGLNPLGSDNIDDPTKVVK